MVYNFMSITYRPFWLGCELVLAGGGARRCGSGGAGRQLGGRRVNELMLIYCLHRLCR